MNRPHGLLFILLLLFYVLTNVDVQVWIDGLILGSLFLYKMFSCLWKYKSEEFKNKDRCKNAFNSLVDMCKSCVFPEANINEFMFHLLTLHAATTVKLATIVFKLRILYRK